MQSPAFSSPGRAHTLAADASRLLASVNSPTFRKPAAVKEVLRKFEIACHATKEIVDRYAFQIDAQTDKIFSLLQSRLADSADYAAVLAGSGRPPITSPEILRLDDLAEQLLESLGRVAGTLLLADMTQSAMRATAESSKLSSIAVAYAQDAKLERRTSITYFSVGSVLVMGALGLVLLGLVHTSSLEGRANSPHASSIWLVFSTYLAASAIAMIASAVLILVGERHRRGGQEATRLSRQFDAVESYLAPMASQTRDLVRASLTPRLFSRILWDDDPIREPIWPTPRDIVSARSPRHRAVRRAPREKETN